MTLMTETVSTDRPPVAFSTALQKARNPSASALALHLDCSRTYIGKLEAEGVIQRQGDGFPLIVAPGVKEDGAELPAT
jgi:hypothetical protein